FRSFPALKRRAKVKPPLRGFGTSRDSGGAKSFDWLSTMPKPKTNGTTKQPRAIASTQSLSAFVKSICDIMRRSNCASALQYVPELTWILFLRILDAQEERERAGKEAVGQPFTPALGEPYRWQDWAAPYN